MNIRNATRSDLEKLAALHADSWKDAYRGVLPQEFLAGQIDGLFSDYWKNIEILKDDIVLVAENHELGGFAAVWCRPDPFIDNLHVRPDLRSKNIGSALMRALVEKLIENGHKTAYLWVFESNVKAVKFYHRLGGIQKERSVKDVFGLKVPSIKIEWDDLSRIMDRTRP